MPVKEKLQGTTLEDFQVGLDDTHGVKRIDDEIALYDPTSGGVKLSEMGGGAGGGVGWRKIVNGQIRTIQDYFTHTTDEIIIEDGGELCQEDDAHFIII